MSNAPCGTYAGYYRHYRRNTGACDACYQAYTQYRAQWRRQQGMPKRPAVSEQILDLLELLGPMTMQQIIDACDERGITTIAGARRAVYRLKQKQQVATEVHPYYGWRYHATDGAYQEGDTFVVDDRGFLIKQGAT